MAEKVSLSDFSPEDLAAAHSVLLKLSKADLPDFLSDLDKQVGDARSKVQSLFSFVPEFSLLEKQMDDLQMRAFDTYKECNSVTQQRILEASDASDEERFLKLMNTGSEAFNTYSAVVICHARASMVPSIQAAYAIQDKGACAGMADGRTCSRGYRSHRGFPRPVGAPVPVSAFPARSDRSHRAAPQEHGPYGPLQPRQG